LLRCRDSEVITNVLKLKKTFNTSNSQRIFDRAKNALLRKRIHQIRRDLANPEENSVLTKEGKFAITPCLIPFEDIIANVQSRIPSLPQDHS
jgi:hypothetical protein